MFKTTKSLKQQPEAFCVVGTPFIIQWISLSHDANNVKNQGEQILTREEQELPFSGLGASSPRLAGVDSLGEVLLRQIRCCLCLIPYTEYFKVENI